MADETSSEPVGPVLGPCTSWISGSDVAMCPPCSEFGSEEIVAELLEQVAVEASMALFELSGQRFNGVCEWTVRPCRDPVDCWGLPSGAGGYGWYWGWDSIAGWAWRDERRSVLCGCKPESVVLLPGYPVREILAVKIDGVVLDPLDANTHRNYRLDDFSELVRMDDPGPPVVARRWPTCQNTSLDDDQPGTFSVRYTWGIDPPPLGMRAAAALACQLALSCPGVTGSDRCLLPEGVTKVVRQGIEIDRKLLLGFFDSTKSTGIDSLDLFVASYCGGGAGVGRGEPAIWSPDMPQYARRLA